jgi:activator of HSP90 ATPase
LKAVLGEFRTSLLGGAGEFWITEVKSFKGESSINIRKGKKIVSYDYNVKLKWQC